MLAKIYWYTWLTIAAVAGILFVSGNMTLSIAVVFGFMAFGMTFMGMMGVLPATVVHPVPKAKPTKREVPIKAPPAKPIQHGVQSVRV